MRTERHGEASSCFLKFLRTRLKLCGAVRNPPPHRRRLYAFITGKGTNFILYIINKSVCCWKQTVLCVCVCVVCVCVYVCVCVCGVCVFVCVCVCGVCVCVCQLRIEFLHIIEANTVLHKANTESPYRLK